VSQEIIGSEEGEREDKLIMGGRSVSWLLDRLREDILDGWTPRGETRLSDEMEGSFR